MMSGMVRVGTLAASYGSFSRRIQAMSRYHQKLPDFRKRWPNLDPCPGLRHPYGCRPWTSWWFGCATRRRKIPAGP